MESDRSPGIEVSLGEPVFLPVPLVPREVMHGGADLPLEDRVALAAPRVIRLEPDEVRAIAGDLVGRYAEGRVDSLRYCLLSIDVSFLHVPAEPIVQATVNISLFNDSPNGQPDPVAIAMVPEIAIRATKRSSAVKFNANLQLVSSEIGRTVEYEGGDPYLQAHKPGRSDPAWFFTQTSAQNLAGPQQLLLVVAMSPHSHCKALLDMSANVRRRRAGLLGYSARLPVDCRLIELG